MSTNPLPRPISEVLQVRSHHRANTLVLNYRILETQKPVWSLELFMRCLAAGMLTALTCFDMADLFSLYQALFRSVVSTIQALGVALFTEIFFTASASNFTNNNLRWAKTAIFGLLVVLVLALGGDGLIAGYQTYCMERLVRYPDTLTHHRLTSSSIHRILSTSAINASRR